MANRRKIKAGSYYGWGDWRCEQRDGHCAVTGRVEATRVRKTIAVVPDTPSVIEEISRLVELVNARRCDVGLLRSAHQALTAIEEEGFTFATEMELEDVIERLEE
jgi:hypothetical protein